nr:immunoglobulin heavy chain junction region [Mus musculus]MBK4197319.1 immunoglobulin heavy chain junction region [Mus musculus]
CARGGYYWYFDVW